MPDDDEIKAERYGRMDERLKAVEAKVASMEARMWGAVILIVVYVANKILGLLEIGGQIP